MLVRADTVLGRRRGMRKNNLVMVGVLLAFTAASCGTDHASGHDSTEDSEGGSETTSLSGASPTTSATLETPGPDGGSPTTSTTPGTMYTWPTTSGTMTGTGTPTGATNGIGWAWVLRDSAGDRVNAVVSPTWKDTYGAILDFGATANSPCVGVQYLDTGYLAVSFELATGVPNDACYADFASWRDANPYFLDDQCTGPAYAIHPSYRFMVNGTLYAPDVAGGPVVPAEYYMWSGGNCTGPAANTSSIRFWPFAPVPGWVLSALPDAPYTVALEYE
jgi:hypothetical protein